MFSKEQQGMISDCGQVLIMPNIGAVNDVKMATVICGTIKVTYKVTGW